MSKTRGNHNFEIPKEDMIAALKEFVESENFEEIIKRYTNKTVKQFIRDFSYITVPLIVTIISMAIYMFTSLTSTVGSLTEQTVELSINNRLLLQMIEDTDKRIDENAKDIRYIIRSPK